VARLSLAAHVVVALLHYSKERKLLLLSQSDGGSEILSQQRLACSVVVSVGTIWLANKAVLLPPLLSSAHTSTTYLPAELTVGGESKVSASSPANLTSSLANKVIYQDKVFGWCTFNRQW